MKRIIFITAIIGFYLSAHAQLNSGSFRIDGELNNINISARADFGNFRTEMSKSYNVHEEDINYYRTDLKMEPADIYFAFEISRVSRRPVTEVIEIYRVKRGNGWGEIAKSLGIKPGSAEFHALKNNAKTKSVKMKSKGQKGKPNGNGSKPKGNGKEKK